MRRCFLSRASSGSDVLAALFLRERLTRSLARRHGARHDRLSRHHPPGRDRFHPRAMPPRSSARSSWRRPTSASRDCARDTSLTTLLAWTALTGILMTAPFAALSDWRVPSIVADRAAGARRSSRRSRRSSLSSSGSGPGPAPSVAHRRLCAAALRRDPRLCRVRRRAEPVGDRRRHADRACQPRPQPVARPRTQPSRAPLAQPPRASSQDWNINIAHR